jgi:hypothetical protein
MSYWQSQQASTTPLAIAQYCARARYRVLVLGGPRDEIITKEDYIPKSGLESVRASYPINIRIDHKLGCG